MQNVNYYVPVIALLTMNRTIEFSCIIWRSHTKVASDTSETSFVIQSKRCGQFFSFRFKNLSLTSHTFSGFINWFDNFVICRSKRAGSGSDTMFDRVASSTINESKDVKKWNKLASSKLTLLKDPMYGNGMLHIYQANSTTSKKFCWLTKRFLKSITHICIKF